MPKIIPKRQRERDMTQLLLFFCNEQNIEKVNLNFTLCLVKSEESEKSFQLLNLINGVLCVKAVGILQNIFMNTVVEYSTCL